MAMYVSISRPFQLMKTESRKPEHNYFDKPYPWLLGNNRWLTILRKVALPIMHDGSVIVRSSKGINRGVLIEVVLVRCVMNTIENSEKEMKWKIFNFKINFID